MMGDGGMRESDAPEQSDPSGYERREFPRAKVPTSIEYRITEEQGADLHPGVLTDLNASGLQFTGERPIESGTRLDLHVQLPSRTQPYQFQGEIVWVRETRSGLTEYGVQFVDVTPDQQFEIDALVRFLMQPPHPKES